MATSANPIMGTLFINGGTKGWSEKFWLTDSTLATAMVSFNLLCKWRASLLAKDFTIAWARVTFADTLRNSKAAILAPLLPTGDDTPAAVTQGFGVVNKTEDGFLFRFETADGQWANRIIRGVPDQDLTDDEIVGNLVINPTPPAVVPAMGVLTWLSFLGNYVGYLVNNTVQSKRLPGNPRTWNLTAWDRAIFRRAAIRRTGRPFDTSRGRRSVA